MNSVLALLPAAPPLQAPDEPSIPPSGESSGDLACDLSIDSTQRIRHALQAAMANIASRWLLFAALSLLAQTAAGSTPQNAADACTQNEPTTVYIPTTVYVTATLGAPNGAAVPQTPAQPPVAGPPTQQSTVQQPARLSVLPPPPQPSAYSSVMTVPKWHNNTNNATVTAQSPTSSTTRVSPSQTVNLVMQPTPSNATKAMRNVLYFTNWGVYGANYQPQMIPADQVTHVLYAFGDTAEDGTIKSSDTYSDLERHYDGDSWNDQGNNAYGCVKQLYIHKKKNRKLKTLLSIGGWTASQAGKFLAFVGTDAGRQKFASSAVKMLGDWGMDGIDIDWEYPKNAQEAQQFVLLLKACRDALDRYAADNGQNYHYLLTAAVAAGPQNYAHLDMKGMDPYLDAWHLMAYDYAGTKFNTEQAVEGYLQGGVPSDKIVLGLPLYGRSFMNTDGLGKPFSGVGQGSFTQGIWLYRDLPRPGATVQIDNSVGAAWSYDPATRELVSYDSLQSALLKANYLKARGLGGAVFWEASGDKTGEGSIVGAMAKSMGELESTENMLSYPGSQYDNIKNNMPGA
ncbi:Endochitinase B1 [Tolypocladium ophioglossoides CBS 100239]|uniref:chitinase n=1 Tax=Tolypocladium ophioglossoides (strain CBS 100239) TaxID=1163406 RepID=A0A0L0N7S2_TOLOC|nr:Endochitinase B1 [Tolypocladium ophioglossoides CBS 100239]